MTFDQVMELTSQVSAPAAFEEPCCRLMYESVMSLRPGSTILEIGVEFGRSTSILAQVAKAQGHKLVLVDPFVDPVSGTRAMEMLARVGCEFVLFKMTTARAFLKYRLYMGLTNLGLAHIDGDHTREGIETDCRMILPLVLPGGLACFHDYGRDSLPDVYPVVNQYMTAEEWTPAGVANTLGVWRRK